MSKLTATEKGDRLQIAVQAIEHAILLLNPALAQAEVTIEPKKTIIVDGVKHEIDVFVSVALGGGYESIFVFECKNWQEAVGKNEIIVFSEKIRACNAARGWFVAPKFTSFATAQAKQDPRCQLLEASDVTDDLQGLLSFHSLHQKSVNIHTQLTIRGARVGQDALSQFRGMEAEVLGRHYSSFDEFLQPVAKEIVDDCLNSSPTETLATGVHVLTAERAISCPGSGLGLSLIESIVITATIEVEIQRLRIISAFDIQARGRSIRVESIVVDGVGQIDLGLVMTLDA